MADGTPSDKSQRNFTDPESKLIGQIKAALGFARFLMRGMKKVQLEWRLVCTAHNLHKLLSAVDRAALAARR